MITCIIKKDFRAIILLVFSFAGLVQYQFLLAQVSIGGQPYSFASTNWSATDVPLINMPYIDIDALRAEDALNDHKGEAYRFGQTIDVNISLQTEGIAEILPDGSRLYRLQIRSKKAKMINLVYNQFQIPDGARFYLYNPDHSDLIGAFTAANNKPHLKFSTGFIKGDVTILEYYEPADAAFPGIINISKVVHGYRGLGRVEKDYGNSGSCNNNVNCPEGADWQDQKRSVALIISGGFRSCTGAMVNNVRENCVPYFLTANHCLDNDVETWVFMFNYESPTCANQDGPTNQTVSGCELKASAAASDFALLELSELPPPQYNIYYSGWSNATAAAVNSTCIHHPSGDIKKITFNNNTVTANDGSIPNNRFWEMVWEDGTTEPGSSGSPLFDQDRRIVGQLYGGSASCFSMSASDIYGSFAYSWNHGSVSTSRLRDWLDPDNTGTITLNGRSCSEPAFDLDAAAVEVLAPANLLCNETSVSPQVVISNYGAVNLTSATVTVSLETGVSVTQNWTGNLDFIETATVTMPSMAVGPGIHLLTISVSNPNGSSDQNAANNTYVYLFKVIIGPEVTVSIGTDEYPEETSFTVSQGTDIIYEGNGLNETNSIETFNFCLAPGCYTLRILDSYGDGITNGTFNVSAAGQTVVSGNTNFGTQLVVQFCIEEPQNVTADFSANDSDICIGQSVMFNAAYSGTPATYSWTFEGGTPATASSPNVTVNYPAAGTYNVSLSVSANGTSAQQTLNDYITVGLSANLLPTNASNPISNDGSIGTAVQIGTPPYTYQWSNGQSTPSASNLAAGTYSVTITDFTGCYAIQNIELGSNIPAMQANITPLPLNICQGETINLSATSNNTPIAWNWQISGPNNYNQNFTTAAPTITLSEAGTYTIQLTLNDAYSSSSTSSTLSAKSSPQITSNITQPTLWASNGAIALNTEGGSPPYTYIWNNGSTENNLSNVGEGSFTVTVSDADGCKTILSENIPYLVNNPSGVVLFPSPAAVVLSAYNSNDAERVVLVELFDAGGRLIGAYNLEKGLTTLPLNAAAGIYLARISIDGQVKQTTKVLLR